MNSAIRVKTDEPHFVPQMIVLSACVSIQVPKGGQPMHQVITMKESVWTVGRCLLQISLTVDTHTPRESCMLLKATCHATFASLRVESFSVRTPCPHPLKIHIGVKSSPSFGLPPALGQAVRLDFTQLMGRHTYMRDRTRRDGAHGGDVISLRRHYWLWQRFLTAFTHQRPR